MDRCFLLRLTHNDIAFTSIILNSAIVLFDLPCLSASSSFQTTQCPSKSVSAAATPTAYYSPSLGNSNSNNNSNNGTNGNAGARLKYDFRILKINYIKDVTPLLSSAGSTSTVTTPTTTPTIPAAGQNHNGQSNNNSIPSSEANSTSEDNSNNNITNNIYSTVLPAVGYVQLDKIQQREQQAIREAQAAAARIGVGVSTIGQDIFDALSKT